MRAHLVLFEPAHREARPGELRAIEREEEVGLVLLRVDAAPQHVAPARLVPAGARVVSGRDGLGVEPPRALHERRELQLAVAVHAGDGRPARGVLAHEVHDDLGLELLLEIHDVVGHAQRRGDPAGVVEVVERAAGPEAHVAFALVVELHRQADDLVAGLDEQARGHRRVHAAGHGHDDAHPSHRRPAGVRPAARARSLATMAGRRSTTRSISASVLPVPRLKRMAF